MGPRPRPLLSHDSTPLHRQLSASEAGAPLDQILDLHLEFNKIKLTKIPDLTMDWSRIGCLRVRHLNHYTRMFSVLVWRLLLNPIHAWVIVSNSSNSSNSTKISSFLTVWFEMCFRHHSFRIFIFQKWDWWRANCGRWSSRSRSKSKLLVSTLPGMEWRRIQDFPDVGAPTHREAPTYDFAKFPQNLHELQRIWNLGVYGSTRAYHYWI